MRKQILRKTLIIMLSGMTLQGTAQASETIRLGRDVMPAIPRVHIAPPVTMQSHVISPRTAPINGTVNYGHRNQGMIDRSAQSITRNVINTTTSEINYHLRNAIQDALGRR